MTIESTVFYITNDFGDSVEVSGGAYDAWLSNPYDGFASASGIAPGGYEKFSISNEKGEDYAGNFQTVVTGIQGYNQGIDQGQQIHGQFHCLSVSLHLAHSWASSQASA